MITARRLVHVLCVRNPCQPSIQGIETALTKPHGRRGLQPEMLRENAWDSVFLARDMLLTQYERSIHAR